MKNIIYPVWQDNRKYLYSKNDILGAFGLWAIRQSPYMFPDNLEKAIKALSDKLDTIFFFNEKQLGFAEISCRELQEKLEKVFEEVDIITAWNEPKSGHGAKYIFADRFSTPNPDDDIIGLGALARNIAHTLTLESLAVEDIT